MLTGDHILHSEHSGRDLRRAWCSCGVKWTNVTDMEAARELQRQHVDEMSAMEQGVWVEVRS